MGTLFGPKREGEIGDWRELRVGELCELCYLPNMMETIKCRKKEFAGHLACVRCNLKI
jgi:hypothetical protein